MSYCTSLPGPVAQGTDLKRQCQSGVSGHYVYVFIEGRSWDKQLLDIWELQMYADPGTYIHIVNTTSQTHACRTTQISSHAVHAWVVTEWIFIWRFWLCPLNDMLDINDRFWFWHWKPLFRDRKSLRTEQSQVIPNANRGCPTGLTSHIKLQLSRPWQKIVGQPSQKLQWGFPILEMSALWLLFEHKSHTVKTHY